MTLETSQNSGQELPRSVQLLIYRLQMVHGPGVLSRGDNGLHLAIASPMGLMKDGSRELYKRHLYVNLDRYLGVHPYEDLSQDERENSGWCVKYRVPYEVSVLLEMSNLEARGHSRGNAAPGEQTITTMVPDFVPDLAGKLTPLLELPEGHPGVLARCSESFRLPGVPSARAGFKATLSP